MARLARVVVPGVAHHVTQRGNRRLDVFFREGDYQFYLESTAEWCGRFGVEVWAYCLMTNHVHLIVKPDSADKLHRAIQEIHQRHTRRINFNQGWRGHLWQGRFSSTPMDDAHTLLATRYVELNPVRAGMVERAEEYRWSSARAHLEARDDSVVKVLPLLDQVEDWSTFLSQGSGKTERDLIQLHERTGRPLGNPGFVERLEKSLGRKLTRGKPGPKPKRNPDTGQN